MFCRVIELRYKDVINIEDGTKIGCVTDVEIDTTECKLISLIVSRRYPLFGLFRGAEHLIYWEDIVLIGDDTILVKVNLAKTAPKAKEGKFKGFFDSFFQ